MIHWSVICVATVFTDTQIEHSRVQESMLFFLISKFSLLMSNLTSTTRLFSYHWKQGFRYIQITNRRCCLSFEIERMFFSFLWKRKSPERTETRTSITEGFSQKHNVNPRGKDRVVPARILERRIVWEACREHANRPQGNFSMLRQRL